MTTSAIAELGTGRDRFGLMVTDHFVGFHEVQTRGSRPRTHMVSVGAKTKPTRSHAGRFMGVDRRKKSESSSPWNPDEFAKWNLALGMLI